MPFHFKPFHFLFTFYLIVISESYPAYSLNLQVYETVVMYRYPFSCHTLAYAHAGCPCQIGYLKLRLKLRPVPDRRSFYSYLGRLKGQGLLERNPNSKRGQLSYRLTERGRTRIEYLRRLQGPS